MKPKRYRSLAVCDAGRRLYIAIKSLLFLSLHLAENPWYTMYVGNVRWTMAFENNPRILEGCAKLCSAAENSPVNLGNVPQSEAVIASLQE